MIFVKTFKGYEDKIASLDSLVNSWIAEHDIEVVDIKTVLAHEPEGRAKSGDLLYTLLYRAEEAVRTDAGPSL